MIRINIEKELKAYSGHQWLKVNREFASGSITKIYGPSGVGKTTFLKMIAGLVQPEKGVIEVDDTLWLDMTVMEHLEYATSDVAWIDLLLKIGKLETFTTHKPEHLSGGQQQRLAILRALAIKPKLLLMDEPFSALDMKMKSALIDELKLLFAELKMTVFIVSHNPAELESFGGEEMVLNQDF